MKARECANLGPDNWCVLRDAQCPILTKHERYSFVKAELHCSWLDGTHIADNKLVSQVGRPTVEETSKKCRGCGKIFKTKNNRLWYCSDVCRSIAKSKTERKSRAKANTQDFSDLKR